MFAAMRGRIKEGDDVSGSPQDGEQKSESGAA
jgi:hypothetical protein